MSFPSFIAGVNDSFIINSSGNININTGVSSTLTSGTLIVSGSATLLSGITTGSIYLNNGFSLTNISSSSNLNFNNISLTGNTNNGLIYCGVNTLFNSINIDGPVLYGYNNFALGITNPTKGILIGSSNGIVTVANTLTTQTIGISGSGTQYQFCCGSTGASSGSGTVTLPYTFKNQPAIICTINSSSTTQLFSITVSNLTKSSFSYYKNFVNVSTAGPTSGGQATNESFNWIALG